MTVDVWPVESGGKFWIEVVIDDRTERRGPFDTADAAGAMARRLLQFSYTLNGGGNRGGNHRPETNPNSGRHRLWPDFLRA
jgi:hypothetical protein